jgi:hypothetical protein
LEEARERRREAGHEEDPDGEGSGEHFFPLVSGGAARVLPNTAAGFVASSLFSLSLLRAVLHLSPCVLTGAAFLMLALVIAIGSGLNWRMIA